MRVGDLVRSSRLEQRDEVFPTDATLAGTDVQADGEMARRQSVPVKDTLCFLSATPGVTDDSGLAVASALSQPMSSFRHPFPLRGGRASLAWAVVAELRRRICARLVGFYYLFQQPLLPAYQAPDAFVHHLLDKRGILYHMPL